MERFVLYAIAISMILGGIDRVFLDNRVGLGDKFQEGFNKMGELAAAMFGMISLAPLFGNLIAPIVKPIYRALGADPAIFAGTILANDMGGYSLAMKLADSQLAGAFGGLVIGAMMGATVVFSIPVGINIISKKARPQFALGILSGIITIPIGAFVSGLLVSFPISSLCMNLVPVVLISIMISLGLWKITNLTITFFIMVSKIIAGIAILGAVMAGTQFLTGLVLIRGMTPIEESFRIVGFITLMLLGAFPLVQIARYTFRGLFEKLGTLIDINDFAVAGIVAALANNLPTFSLFDKMDERGKVVSAAFCVSGSFVLGDHLAFTAANNSEFIIPVIIGKLIGGLSGIILALLIINNKK
ncbi:MAG: ethanolamine utilization protein EutH [Candidatus Yanofskybacteria bacterium]|nr:ethanolamine utilization protein EutH [Candidatus Yanofskybacteria bacterium]